MKKILIILSFLLIYGELEAQYKPRKKDLVDLSAWMHSGWHLGPGLTYMAPFKPKGDSVPLVDPNGRLAVYLEVGRWHMFPGGGNIFNYFDYGLAYKRLSGSEEFANQKSVFKQNYVLANFNINNMIQLSNYTFLQNSLGFNLDFNFLQKKESSLVPINQNTQKLLFSLHYKFGFGIRATNNMFVIPTLETPILNAKQWEKGRSDYGLYASRYRPVIFTLRLIWLRKPSKGSCPPTPGGDGKKYDEMLQME